jgi:hypothetical protein
MRFVSVSKEFLSGSAVRDDRCKIAITPWHALSNRVEFLALGRRRAIGDMLSRDEATELAHELRRAVGVSG